MSIDTKDIIWLAGLLEGEGCFNMSGSRNGSARISLNMTDKDVVERAASIMKAPLRIRPKRENRKQVFSTELFSNRAAAWMMTLYPLMGMRRKQAIEDTLSIWKNQRFKNKSGLGRKNPRSKKEREQSETAASRYRIEP